MKAQRRRLVSLLCALALLTGLLLPSAGAAVPLLGEDLAVAEEPAPQALQEDGGRVGTMPGHSHSEATQPLTAGDGALLAAAAAQEHNFTTSGTESGFFTITGSLSTSKGTASYNGLTLTQCLKMETSTKITFDGSQSGTLTLVFGSAESGKRVSVDGNICTTDSSGVVTVELTARSTAHEIKKSDSINLFYLSLGRKAAEAHSFVRGAVLSQTPATCTAAGSRIYACAVANCAQSDHTETETLPKIDHAYEPGAVYCNMCGQNKNDPSDVHTAHTWGSWVVDVASTCTVAGSRHRTCTNNNCKKTQTETLELSAHDYTGAGGACKYCGATMGSVAGGWFEAMYAELVGVSPNDVTAVSWTGTASGSLTATDLQYLVREAQIAMSDGSKSAGTRIDVPGLKAGSYDLTVTMKTSSFTAKGIQVMAHDRSGFAHYNYTSGVGAYNDDGTLKSNAIVLYVNEANKNTVKLTVGNTTVSGIGNILNSKGKSQNGNKGILKTLADAKRPLVVRIVGTVVSKADSSKPNGFTLDGVTAFNSSNYGGSAGDNGGMCRMQDTNNVTIEGIGADAVMDGWGLHFVAETAGYGKGFEVRNLKFRNVPEDCVGMEGKQNGTGLSATFTAPVERCWIHNCEFYVPKIANPAESDKAEGDGACDFKRGQYMTMDYCYYEGYHKTNLVGASKDNIQFHITWHHNYYKNCESRGPLSRQANIHIYNTIYDGQTSYAQNPRANSYIFSEYNLFINECKKPATLQSPEGGNTAVKSYNDWYDSIKKGYESEATQVTSKSTKVSSGCKYANFDTNASVSYIPDSKYALDTDKATMQARIAAYTGTMKPADKVEAPDIPEPSTPAVHSHVWSGWTVTANATCTAAGAQKRTCSGEGACPLGGVQTEVIPATGHSWGGWTVTGEATCTADGTQSRSCTNDKSHTETKTIPATGHSWGPWSTTKAPTCITAGVQTRTCSACGEVQTGSVAATGVHVYDPTTGRCTADPQCVATNPAGGQDPQPTPTPTDSYVHNFTDDGTDSSFYHITGNLSTGKGTVNYNGLTLTQCLKMETSTEITFTAPAAGGTLTLVLAESAGTIKVDGTKLTASGGVITTALEGGAHTVVKADSANLFYMVFVPDAVECANHVWGAYTVTRPATCVDAGEKVAHCVATAGCPAIDTQVIPPTGQHDYGTGNYCSVCGHNKTGGAAHTQCTSFQIVGAKAATCKEVGYTGDKVCTVCGKVNTPGTAIPTTAHSWSGASCSVCGTAKPTGGAFTRVGGWFETAYAQWSYLQGANSYQVYVKKSGGSYTPVDDQLIRQYASYLRVDVPGLSAGQYQLKVVPLSGGVAITGAEMESEVFSVRSHVREGFAFEGGNVPGGYTLNGTPKENAQIIYVTNQNKDSVTAQIDSTGKGAQTVTGVQNILTALKKGKEKNPLILRFIGNIDDPADMPNGDLYVDAAVNGLTIEGIGADTVFNGFGVVIKNSSNVEVRNIGFMNCNSTEGDDVGLQQKNDHIWVHNCDFFYGDAGSDADQVKGDGALDTKTSTFVTHSYNHFWDNGKCNLQGMKSEATTNYITYHHNWYDHSDSRHPRIRTCTVHIYNNYYDGNAKYGVGVTMGASAFVEKNYFRSTSTIKPMLISMQGTDIASGAGSFSGESGGVIKAFDNIFAGNTRYAPYSATNTVEFDAYEVTSRNQQVPSSVKSKSGGTSYNNFDTDASLMYAYSPSAPGDVVSEVEGWSGRMEGGDLHWEFDDATEDGNYAVIQPLKNALVAYESKLQKVGGTVTQSSTVTPPAACAHSSTRAVTTQAATCTATGLQSILCNDCGVTVGTETIPTIDHSLRWVVTTQPSCAQGGVETSTCSVCNGQFGTRALSATGHSWGSDGLCSECGEAKPSGGDPVVPDPPATQSLVHIFRAKEDLWSKLNSNGADKNSNPIYTCSAAETKTGLGSDADGGADPFFSVYFSANAKVDFSNKSWEDDYSSNYRVNFNGGGVAVKSNAIGFTTDYPATVTVWWVQSDAAGTRQIAILNDGGATVAETNGDAYTQNSPYMSTLTLPQAGTYYLGGSPKSNYIFKVQVTETKPAGGEAPEPPVVIEKDALTDLIAQASTLRADTVLCDENGVDVPKDQYWVSESVMQSFADAIGVAQTVVGDDSATQSAVDSAAAALQTALERFQAARRPGTLEETVEPAPEDTKVYLLDVTSAIVQTSGSIDGKRYVEGYYTVVGEGNTASADFLLTAKGFTPTPTSPDYGYIEFEITGSRATVEVWASSTNATNRSPIALTGTDGTVIAPTAMADSVVEAGGFTYATGYTEPSAPTLTYALTNDDATADQGTRFRLGSPTDGDNNRGVRIYQIKITETGSTFCDHASLSQVVADSYQTPTCTTDGKSADYRCTTCGRTIQSGVTLPRTGHTFGQDGLCVNCGEEEQTHDLALVFDNATAEEDDGYLIAHPAPEAVSGYSCDLNGQTLSQHIKLVNDSVIFRAPADGKATLHFATEMKPVTVDGVTYNDMNGWKVLVNGVSYTIQDDQITFPTDANTDYALERDVVLAADGTSPIQPRLFAVEWENTVDRSALLTALERAETAQAGVVTSANGSDVEREDLWVSGAQLALLSQAVWEAGTVNENKTATTAQVNAATAQLLEAIDAFNKAKQQGLVDRAGALLGQTVNIRWVATESLGKDALTKITLLDSGYLTAGQKVFAACWGADNAFLGVKILTSNDPADLPDGTVLMKLMWLDQKAAPLSAADTVIPKAD